VLDFGLAKAFQEEHTPTLSNSPTLIGASVPGVILGTAAYMSPEQAKGKDADRSSDIWALGCVLYEMLTAHATFEGETIAEIFAAVFKAEPDWRRLPAETPEAIRRLLRRCLQKDRNERLKSADAARIEIKESLSAPGCSAGYGAYRKLAAAMVRGISRGHWLCRAGHCAFSGEAGGGAPEMRVDIATPATSAPLEFALSPNGQYIVFVASGDGPQRLWLRALDKTEAQPLAGTEGADTPFWSADSRSIGFLSTGKLKRIDIAGGPPRVLANIDVLRPGTWNETAQFCLVPVRYHVLRRREASQ